VMIKEMVFKFLFLILAILIFSGCSDDSQTTDREIQDKLQKRINSILNERDKSKNNYKNSKTTTSISLKDKYKAQTNSKDTATLNSRRGIAIMAGDPSNDLGRMLKGFKDDDKVVTVTFKFGGSSFDKKFKDSLYRSSVFTKILNNDTSSKYFAQWSNQFDLIIKGVMSKKYFATLKYYKISDSQIKKMRKVVSSDKQECTSDKNKLNLDGPWKPNTYTWFETGPRSIAKFGLGYQTKNFLNNEFFEFDKSISIDDIFDPGRSYSDKDNLEDFSLSKNKFYYTMPNGEVRYGFYSISAPHNGQSNELINKWVENRLKFKCLRDSVN